MRSLQSMFIAASTEGFIFEIGNEGEIDYTGKNPRDAFQACRYEDEVIVTLIKDGFIADQAVITPGTEDYMVDCTCDGFFEKWSK